MDDVLIIGCVRKQHNVTHRIALIQIKSAGIILNKDKNLFGQEETHFFRSCGNNGTAAMLQFTAIAEMKTPENISKLRCFLGMAKQL